MQALHDLCDTPFYKEAKVLVRKDWVTLFESNNVLKVNNVIQFDNNINNDDVDNFEKVIENAPTNSLV